MNYQKIRKELKTGDIMLFSGESIVSNSIKLFSRSKWSHLAMVYRIDDGDIAFCWESTSLGKVEDIETGKKTKGVQLVVLSDRIEQCLNDGYQLAIRQLNKPITKDMFSTLKEFRHEVKGTPYEQDFIELVKSAHDGWLGDNEEDLSSLFCSELVAAAYQKMGLLGKQLPSNEYVPKDFSTEREISLLNKYKFGPEVAIDSV